MGFQKIKRPLFTQSVSAAPVQSISLSGASGVSTAVINGYGATFITSTGTGAAWTLNLAPPIAPGTEKVIGIYLSGASTVPVTVRTASSSQVFWGSTKNGITMTTAAGSSAPMLVTLLARTTKQWAIKSIGVQATTFIPFLTSTASTA